MPEIFSDAEAYPQVAEQSVSLTSPQPLICLYTSKDVREETLNKSVCQLKDEFMHHVCAFPSFTSHTFTAFGQSVQPSAAAVKQLSGQQQYVVTFCRSSL